MRVLFFFVVVLEEKLYDNCLIFRNKVKYKRNKYIYRIFNDKVVIVVFVIVFFLVF